MEDRLGPGDEEGAQGTNTTPPDSVDAAAPQGSGAAPAGRGLRLRPYAAMGGAGLLLAIGWKVFYAWRSPTFILTPFEGSPPLAPLYAFFRPDLSLHLITALLVLAGGIVACGRLRRHRRGLFLVAALLFAVSFRFAVHAARDGTLPGREFLTYEGEDVIFDVGRIDSAWDFLRDYTALQPRLSLHGRTKPPGFALMHYAIMKMFGDHVLVVGSLLTILAGLIVVPAFYLGFAVRREEEDGQACALLAATAPGLVLYGAVSLDALFAVVAAVTMVASVRELRRPIWTTRLAIGLLLCAGMMLSYSTFIVGLFAAVLLILDRWRRPWVCLAHLTEILLAFLLPYAALALGPGFNAWASFLIARRLNQETMTRIVGHALSGVDVWAYASSGNLLAFLIALGVPVAGSWFCLASHEFGRMDRLLGGAFLAALLAACLGGLYLMETDRILLYLAPPAFVLAALPRGFPRRSAAALCGLQAIAMELLLRTLW
jgi:Dolichyl-phosphate-mannose-protein mannosyltransferase